MDRIEYEKNCLKLAKAKLRRAKAALKRTMANQASQFSFDGRHGAQIEVDRAQHQVDVIKRRIAELEG